jgi:hypothetical protein
MKLYVMNATIRDHELTWRWAEDNSYRFQKIAAGQQAVIVGDTTEDRVKQIIDQNERYGMRNINDLAGEKSYVGLVYSVNEPVSFDKIDSVIEHNASELASGAAERMEATAHAIQENTSRMTGKEVKRVEIEQVETGTVNAPDSVRDNPSVALGTELVAEGIAPRHKGRTAPNRQA